MQQPLNLLSSQELLHAYAMQYYYFLGNHHKYYLITGLGPSLPMAKINHENGWSQGEELEFSLMHSLLKASFSTHGF